MKHLLTMRAVLFLFAGFSRVVAQEKSQMKMREKRMLEMMKDSSMMNMMIGLIAPDRHIRMQMMLR